MILCSKYLLIEVFLELRSRRDPRYLSIFAQVWPVKPVGKRRQHDGKLFLAHSFGKLLRPGWVRVASCISTIAWRESVERNSSLSIWDPREAPMDCTFTENDYVSCFALGLLHIVSVEFLILSVYHLETWSKVDLVGAWHHTEAAIACVLVSEHE